MIKNKYNKYLFLFHFFSARTKSQEFLNELNDAIKKIESYINCLQHETVDRTQLIDALEVAVSYYNKQNAEVKSAAQVYIFICM